MLRKFAGLAVLAVAGVALVVPDASFARGGGGGGGGGFRGGGFRGPAAIHRAPFMVRTGPAALGRNGRAFRSTLPPRIAKPVPVQPHVRPIATHVGRPFAHLARRDFSHHRRSFSNYGYVYPYTSWDDGSYAGSYIGVPYDPGAAIPVYTPGPLVAPVLDPPPPRPVPRIGMRDDGGETCRAERVTVPGDKGDREITVVRC
ncbi:MAG: hypothetical protein WCE79_17205 [Xanthobacteraceae bacterium]